LYDGRDRYRPSRDDRALQPGRGVAAALLGFFVVTLAAVIVNVALPHVRRDLHGQMSDLQWVLDGYTLMFAALLLSAGSLSDRIGARRAFGIGLVVFVLASAACGLAPNLAGLIAARFVQGAAVAATMPSSMALVSNAYPDPVERARAVALWSMGGVAASTSGPILGGLLTTVTWRLIFFVNVPVGAVALVLLARSVGGPRQLIPFDWAGQVTAVSGMGALTYGAIETGAVGIGTFLADRATFVHGVRVSLLIGAVVSLAAAGVSRLIKSPTAEGETR
jgi:DHA2 family methylenomycin A resistance protein-like MFS transporter